MGASVLLANATGAGNTALGAFALDSNVAGSANTAVGVNALTNVTASNSTAVGTGALANATTGDKNVALGLDAGSGITVGSRNIILGASAGFSPLVDDNIVIGHDGSNNAGLTSGTIRIGTTGTHVDTRIAGINGTAIPGPVTNVVINANGQLGTSMSSSKRTKEAVRDMGALSEQLLALRPVVFRYRAELLPPGTVRTDQYGLIAEEVDEVNPDWVQHDEIGRAHV